MWSLSLAVVNLVEEILAVVSLAVVIFVAMIVVMVLVVGGWGCRGLAPWNCAEKCYGAWMRSCFEAR